MSTLHPKSWPRKVKILAVIGVIIAGGGVYYYNTQSSESSQTTFTTSQARTTDLAKTLTLSGTVQQSNIIFVYTKVSGLVASISVTDGQQVQAGDTLAEITLDSEGQTNQAGAWSQYLSAKNSVDSSQNQLNNYESTMWAANDNFIHNAVDLDLAESQSEYIQANREWLAAENNYLNQADVIAQKQAAQTQAWSSYQLYQSTITAPITGTIVGLNITPGMTISYNESSSGNASSQTVARIQTQGNPVALFYATEVDIPLISVGQPVTIELDSIADTTFSGTVTAVDRVGTITSNVTQYQVLVTFDESDPAILPNMSATADLILEQKDAALSVPAAALIEGRSGEKIVRILRDGAPVPTPVEVGIETDTQVEIISGIEEGAVVITGTSTGETQEAGSNQNNQNRQGNFGTGGFGGGVGGPPAGRGQ